MMIDDDDDDIRRMGRISLFYFIFSTFGGFGNDIFLLERG